MFPLAPTVTWIPFQSLLRLLLALLVGLFVGIEREWRGKDAGLRTFGLVSLLGAMGSMLGTGYALMSVGLVGVLVVFLNINSMRQDLGTELTTSAALLVTVLSGALCGLGHTITPVAIAVVSTGLLSWKERLAEFGHRLTAEELRSAILLGILAFAVYPALPDHAVDPWGLVEPRAAWVTVILIAAIGFANYVLWKFFGTRGIDIAGFLGGLVNSTVTVTELAMRVAELGGPLERPVYRGLLLSVAAMAVRNAIILGVFQAAALVFAGGTLLLVFVGSVVLALLGPRVGVEATEVPLAIRSPFSLRSALKFGAVFLGLQLFGGFAQRWFGHFGFYVVSVLGGLVSSASAVAAAAMLAAQARISPAVAGIGAVLASIASVAVNIVIVARVARSRTLLRRFGLATVLLVALGVAGVLTTARLATDARIEHVVDGVGSETHEGMGPAGR